MLDYGRLRELARERRREFRQAKPFPHVVIDGFLPEHVLEPLIAEFPPPDAPLAWRKHPVGLIDVAPTILGYVE